MQTLITLMITCFATLLAAGQPVANGSAVVDGNPNEWTNSDFYKAMYEAGNPKKSILSNSYLRYDCTDNVLYVLVSAEDGYTAQKTAEDAWVKVYSFGNSPRVDGNSSNFAWVYKNGTLAGYEASFSINPGSYNNDLEIHINIVPGRTASTGKKKQGYSSMHLQCENGLDVDLGAFDAVLTDKGIELSWNTVAESNHAGFHVWRQAEGEPDFIRLTNKLLVNMQPGEAAAYEFTDSERHTGWVRYKLEDLGLNGESNFSEVVTVQLATNVQSDAAAAQSFQLLNAYPNPFNPTTTIGYQLAEPGMTTLKIYDTLGREVAMLVNEYQAAGSYHYTWNAMDSHLSSGMFFYTLTSGQMRRTKRLMLVQ